MPVGGAKPKPTGLKILHGNPGHHKLNKAEPKPAPLISTDPPEWLKDEHARAAWTDFLKWLDDASIVTVVDLPALELLCSTYAHWREAHEKVSVDVYKTQSGYSSQDPMINVEVKYAKLLQSMLGEFGMTPSSRARVQARPNKDGDEWDEFLNAGGK